jgi:hypothetical protein
MSVQDIVDHVVEALARAESLFTTPADTTALEMTAAVSDASQASRAIGVRTDELGGALASAHHDALSDTTRRLEDIGDTDSQLVYHLTRAANAHASGGSQATDVRVGTEEIPSRLGESSELPCSELATLLALRNQLASMQRLLAQHTSQAARDADVILGLGY